MKLILLAIVTAGLFAASKSEFDLQTKLADTRIELAQVETHGSADRSAGDQSAQAAETAAEAAARAQAIVDDTRSQNYTVLIVQLCSLLAVIAKFVYDDHCRKQEREWAKEDADKRNDSTKASVLDAIAAGAAHSAKAIDHANHLTEKVVSITQTVADMRADMVAALQADKAPPAK